MRRAAVLAAVLAGGCVDGAHPLRRATRPSVERMRERERRASWTRIADPPEPARWSWADRERGYVLAGPLRVEVARGGVRAADDVTPSDIERAVRAARGWLFFTDRGGVYASATFTGRLRPLGMLDCLDPEDGTAAADVTRAGFFVPRPSEGRAVFTVQGGRDLYWSDGAVLRRVADPDVVAVAWQGERLGAEIVRYRTIRVTADGGRTWRDAGLGGDLPLALAGTPRGLFALTTAGWRRLDEQARLLDGEPELPRLPSVAVLDARATSAVARALADGHEVAATPRVDCLRGADAATPPVTPWEPPSFTVESPSLPSSYDREPSWVFTPPGTPAPLGERTELWRIDNAGAPAAIAARELVDDPEVSYPLLKPGTPMEVAWRGEDARGPFAVRVRTRVPPEVTEDHPPSGDPKWRLVVATRVGALLIAGAYPPGVAGLPGAAGDRPVEEALFWLTRRGFRRVHAAGVGALALVRGVASDDGGVAVLALERFDESSWAFPPDVAVALRIGPDGSLLGLRRAVAHERTGEVAGLGELDGAWGIATVGPGDSEFRLLPIDGGERRFGRWDSPGTPPVCGAEPAGARLHLFRGPYSGGYDALDFVPPKVAIGPDPTRRTNDFAEVRRVTFERASDGAACVRSVAGVRSFDCGPNDCDYTTYSALRLTARDGRLEGTCDHGVRVATVTGVVRPYVADDE